MRKFCVFCGGEPKSKNKEHVIPKWLIEKTGDPDRVANFGVDLGKSPLKLRSFSFDAFTFPACRECNETFGSLESAAKPVVESLLVAGPISNRQFSIVFDWLDKIRIGLWLGYFYLNKNVGGITPSYHIGTRVRQSDRTAVIIHVRERQPGINFIGPESPCFQHSPTCLALLINQWCVLNVVGRFSISRRIGFPYLNPIHLDDKDRMEVSIENGTKRIMRPVHRGIVLANCTTLHQPIFPTSLMDAKIRALFDDEWLRSRCIDRERGLGSVFKESHDQVMLYPVEPSCEWVPERAWTLKEIYGRIPAFVVRRLEADLEHSAELVGSQRRKQILQHLALSRRVDSAIIQMAKKSLS